MEKGKNARDFMINTADGLSDCLQKWINLRISKMNEPMNEPVDADS